MPKTRQLLRREITYSEAKTEEVNILHQLEYPAEKARFFAHLNDHREWMKTAVAHHLGLRSSDDCYVADIETWRHGSFNVCVPIRIDSGDENFLMMRFPLPYRVGESFRPGNADENFNVPIPKLYGFALSTGETFTRLEYLPFFPRCFDLLRQRFLSWLGKPVPSNYARHQSTDPIFTSRPVDSGYVLIEYILNTRGSMLSNTWEEKRHDLKLRTNLFRDLSRIFLNITRVPAPRIGSFIIDKDGYLRLANRPLSVEIEVLENEMIPTDMPRDYTYSTVDSYVLDILGIHDNRFRYQPNAVNHMGDLVYQLSVLTAMRTLSRSIFNRAFCRGPFVFNFTDCHRSNILVDEEWHITSLIDLEWTCTQPIEMFQPPYWLTSDHVDTIVLEEYDTIRHEFMDVLKTEEQAFTTSNRGTSQLQLSEIMEQSWESGAFWYTLALSSPTAIFRLFDSRIRPMFLVGSDDEFQIVMPFLFEKKIGRLAHRKLEDREEYDKNLQQAFEDHSG
ncbi:hypothetical protein N7474_007679 [Penicillium riverlandense]|uniref:uncharacterized protein n=1 Tax=Penicillium riverlandense TaxID=1903569 RepID=UPI0025472125|nr:uncharacterized protein N7474_007679 [Penicillium riverlandense]KAJ5811378.1 hypothetical protein N7474_007679 [Penicillium riverlandense]